MNFNVLQIKDIIRIINDTLNNFSKISNYSIDCLQKLSQVVSSEDSGLTSTYTTTSSVINNLSTQTHTVLNDLISAFDAYANATVNNQDNSNQEIQNITSELDDVNSLLNSINSGVSAGGPVAGGGTTSGIIGGMVSGEGPIPGSTGGPGHGFGATPGGINPNYPPVNHNQLGSNDGFSYNPGVTHSNVGSNDGFSYNPGEVHGNGFATPPHFPNNPTPLTPPHGEGASN